MSKRETHWRLFQFGLKTILWLMIAAAVAVTWWRHWMQSKELAAAQDRLHTLEAEHEFQSDVNRVLRGLQYDDPEHRQALASLKHMGGWPLFRCRKKPIAKLDVLVFQQLLTTIPGIETTIIVALRDDNVIDLVHRSESTRAESHHVTFSDIDEDGRLDVAFRIEPGMWGARGEGRTIGYKVTDAGFVEIEEREPSGANR